MRILTEVIGGILLLLVFAYGLEKLITKLVFRMEMNNADDSVPPATPDVPADDTKPGSGHV